MTEKIIRVATSYRVPTSNGTSYRTKIHLYDGRNGHKLSFEFRTMPSYCIVRQLVAISSYPYVNFTIVRCLSTIACGAVVLSYDSLCRACCDPAQSTYLIESICPGITGAIGISMQSRQHGSTHSMVCSTYSFFTRD